MLVINSLTDLDGGQEQQKIKQIGQSVSETNHSSAIFWKLLADKEGPTSYIRNGQL